MASSWIHVPLKLTVVASAYFVSFFVMLDVIYNSKANILKISF